MFVFSFLLFATVLVVLAAAAFRGLSHVDQILKVVDTTETASSSRQPRTDA